MAAADRWQIVESIFHDALRDPPPVVFHRRSSLESAPLLKPAPARLIE
jgi:hypothetical protein